MNVLETNVQIFIIEQDDNKNNISSNTSRKTGRLRLKHKIIIGVIVAVVLVVVIVLLTLFAKKDYYLENSTKA